MNIIKECNAENKQSKKKNVQHNYTRTKEKEDQLVDLWQTLQSSVHRSHTLFSGFDTSHLTSLYTGLTLTQTSSGAHAN